MRYFLLLSFLVGLKGNCQPKKKRPETATAPVTVPVDASISEASGITDSKAQPGNLWVIEDGGNPPQLILLGHNGKIKQKLSVSGATNRDWEDIVLANGQLYIGDIGDNNRVHQDYTIYRLPEPTPKRMETSDVKTIRFRYADGAHDAEAFLVEPANGNIYIITKRDAKSLVFKITYPYSFTAINLAEKVRTLPFAGAVSASLAPDGSNVLIKTYGAIYRFARNANEPLEITLGRTPVQVPYRQEPQGEAISHWRNGPGYFTLSERFLGAKVNLVFYAFDSSKPE